MPKAKDRPITPLLIIQERHDVASGTNCPLVNVHLADTFEGGASTFMSAVAMLGPVADRWAELLAGFGVEVERWSASTERPVTDDR